MGETVVWPALEVGHCFTAPVDNQLQRPCATS